MWICICSVGGVPSDPQRALPREKGVPTSLYMELISVPRLGFTTE